MRACADACAVLAAAVARCARGALRVLRARAAQAAAALLSMACAFAATAHEVPGELRIHAFVKPDGANLHAVVRVPLALLANLDLPKRDGTLLDLARAEARLPGAASAIAHDLVLFEGQRALVPARTAARVSPAGERSFSDYATAYALVTGPPLAPATDVVADQGYLDAYYVYPLTAPPDRFALDFRISPGLGDRLKLDVRYLAPSGSVHAFEIPAGSPRLDLDPRWYQAAWTFVQGGFWHILDGVDHLLFLLCLVLPFRRVGWTLVGVVTAFTVAHSVTLIAAAYGVAPGGAWFGPLIETLIAASIVYMAIENGLRPDLRRRWAVTFVFGLVHGFGFSFLLRSQLQFAGSHLLTSLLAFNVGIELGQLLVLAILLPVLMLVRAFVPRADGAVTPVLSLAAGGVALWWLVERVGALGDAGWPQPVAWAALALAAVVAAVLVVRGRNRSRAELRNAPESLTG